MSLPLQSLKPNQRKAYVEITRLTQRGFSVAEAAKKAKVKIYDYYNAKARLLELSTERSDARVNVRAISRIEATKLQKYFGLIKNILEKVK